MLQRDRGGLLSSHKEVRRAGRRISAEVAKAKAEREYERYQAQEGTKPRMIDTAFETVAKQLAKPGSTRAKKRPREVMSGMIDRIEG